MAYIVPSGNISGMTFGGSSSAPKTSSRPKRRPTDAETQVKESAADRGGEQDNKPNVFQPAISTDFGGAQVSYGGGPLVAPRDYQPAAGKTPQFILDMTQAERDAIEQLEGEPDVSNSPTTPYANSVAALREQDQRIGLIDLFSPIKTLGQIAGDTSNVDLPYTNPYTEQTIYQRPDGTYYGKNFLGLPYEVNEAGEDITDYSKVAQMQAAQKAQDSSDSRSAPTVGLPAAGLPAAADSTDFNPNNAFLRDRMAQMRGQQGMLPPPQIPGLPPQPRPQMPQQLAGIMQLQDRSNISPAMRYAAENYYRLGGRQMMDDEFERGRGMIQGQSV